jgi:hypothetical protein
MNILGKVRQNHWEIARMNTTLKFGTLLTLIYILRASVFSLVDVSDHLMNVRDLHL